MIEPAEATTDLTLPDGRIFKVTHLQIFGQNSRDVRYFCAMDVHQYSTPRDCFDFHIFLHHDLFRWGELRDWPQVIGLYALGQASLYLAKCWPRDRWSSKTIEIHCRSKRELRALRSA